MMAHTFGSVANLDALPGRMGAVKNAARAEYNAIQPSLLGHRPGGHPGWVKGLQNQLKAIYSMPGTPGPAWNPGSLGASHHVAGGVLRFARGGMVPLRSFDRGGVLPPGLSLSYNGLGKPEPLTSAAAGCQTVKVQLDITGGDAELVALLRRIVRVRGGGNVQTALGR